VSNYNVKALKAEIKVLENEHRAERKELREAQRALSAWDADTRQDKKWSDRYPLCDRIGSLIRSTTSRKEDLTLLYQARASIRGRLHAVREVIHKPDGSKETRTWDLTSQAEAVARLLKRYELPDEEKPAA